MKPVEFKMTVPRSSPTMKAEYLSVVVPLVGRVPYYPQDLPAAMKRIRQRYQLRICELARIGWASADSSAFVFAQNCPSCCVQCKPSTRPCHLPICPFCFARRVNYVYTKVRALIRAEKGTMLTYRQFGGYIQEYDTGIYFDCDGGLEGNLEEVLAVNHACPRQFREAYLADSVGGFYWYTLAPLVYHQPAPDGSCGRWLRLHSCVAVMPPDWTAEIDDTIIIKNPSDFTIAKLIGSIFRYPKGWLASDPVVMTEFLNAIKGKRFLSPFGYFRRAPKPDTNGAAASNRRSASPVGK